MYYSLYRYAKKLLLSIELGDTGGGERQGGRRDRGGKERGGGGGGGKRGEGGRVGEGQSDRRGEEGEMVMPYLSELEELVEKEWRCVVVFFMLRQALAPCVEDMILLDRTLYLMEQGLYNVVCPE